MVSEKKVCLVNVSLKLFFFFVHVYKYIPTYTYICRTNKNQQKTDVNLEEQKWDIIIYSILIGVLFVSTIFRSIIFFAICMRASVRLHKKIFFRLLRAPVAFFDTNPAGRILNRFTKDVGIIDEMLPFVAYDLNMVRLIEKIFFK